MAEYVEKAAFREHLDSVPPFTKYGQRDPKYDFAKTVFLSELAAYPATDVVPVRHGRWIKAKGSWATPGGDPVWECSECGKGRHVYGIEYGTYGSDVAAHQWVACPNCGASMDGGAE